MLEIGSIDLSKIFKTSSIGTNGQTQQPQKEEFEKALFSFGTQNKDFSDNDMKKLEEEFLSAANTAGKTNPFEKKNSSTDSLEREKEQKIDEIKTQILNRKTNLKCPICGEPLITRIARMHDLEDNLVLQPKAHCVKCVFQIKE